MSDLKQIFEAAVARMSLAPPGSSLSLTQEQLLRMYALHRQAVEGDLSGPRPQFNDLVERSKHEAWSRLRGLGRDDAMRRYIAEVEDILSMQRRA